MRVIMLAVLACVSLVGCAKKETVDAPPPKPEPTRVVEFKAASKVDLVEVEKNNPAISTGSVVADFNMDGVDDVAVVEDTGVDTKEVVIYIGQKGATGGVTEQLRKYGRAGAIQGVGDGRITGIASRRRDKYTDLIILVEPAGKSPEMIHYRNSGDKFELVDDGQVSQ